MDVPTRSPLLISLPPLPQHIPLISRTSPHLFLPVHFPCPAIYSDDAYCSLVYRHTHRQSILIIWPFIIIVLIKRVSSLKSDASLIIWFHLVPSCIQGIISSCSSGWTNILCRIWPSCFIVTVHNSKNQRFDL